MFTKEGLALLVSCVVLLSVDSGLGSEIIDGEEVEPHSLPYMAGVMDECEDLICGGTLISPIWVLTAAHCYGPKKITTVMLGVHNVSDDEEVSRQYRNVIFQIIHPRYKICTNDNDMMLLKLDEAVSQTYAVKPFPLHRTMKEPAAGTKCLVAGWGAIDYTTQESSDVLLSANVFMVGRERCRNIYTETAEITTNMICAGSDGTNNADPCQGDSGGPLVCNGAVVGVTSFGLKCGFPNIPSVYAFLSTAKLQWIKRMMQTFEI